MPKSNTSLGKAVMTFSGYVCVMNFKRELLVLIYFNLQITQAFFMFWFLQGVFDPNKISGVGTNFGLLVHVLPGPNKQRAWKPSISLR